VVSVKNFLLGTSNCLFCAIEIVGKKYDISVETLENLVHAFLFSLAGNQRIFFYLLILKDGPEINH
jgi:hypothetical protein